MKTCPLCEKSWPSQHTTCPTDGALLIDTRELEPDTLIRGKYRIVRQLGRGGMGTVYLAEHILLSRLRALKFISSELSQDAAFLRRFRREAQAATELLHPNVVQVVDLDQAEDGSPYIAMEFVDGPDLRKFLRDYNPDQAAEAWVPQVPILGPGITQSSTSRFVSGHDFSRADRGQKEVWALAPEGSLPVPLALHIARGIAQGLGAAHAKGIVHRDVKPENILLARTPNGEETPKLLDFGIAAMKETATAVSRTHGLMLTPPYAAPEQWKGMAAEELDGRTDLYALGGVLYEMLTGQTPFHAHNTEGWMYQHLHEPPQPPSALRPELANWSGLDALVLRLLAKDREQRFPSAADLLEALALTPSQVHAATVIQHTPAPRTPTVVEPPPPQVPPAILTPSKPTPPPAPTPSDTDPPPATKPSPAPIRPRPFPIRRLSVVALLIITVAVIWLANQPSTWTDPATGLTWSKKDNGSDVNWQQATDYCSNLQLSGYSDWRLPTIDELQGIYDRNAQVDDRNWHYVKGNLNLSGVWHWSSSRKNANGGASIFTFLFDYGKDYALNSSDGGRALCVRGSASNGSTPAANSATDTTQPTSASGTNPAAQPGTIPTPTQSIAEIETQAEAFHAQKRYVEARPLYQKACDGGNMEGCNYLGRFYDYGHGVTRDYAQARTFYQKACDGGLMVGCSNLGTLYQAGQGVTQDYAQARTLYKKACDGGYMLGCNNLGVLYYDGEGVTQDYVQARVLYKKACDGGEPEGCKNLKNLH